jgi:AraC-like DNA-binding protein
MLAQHSRTPRPYVDLRSIDDVDAIGRAVCDGLQAEYVQLESKPFRARWTTVRFCSLVIQLGSEDCAVVRRLRVPSDRFAFIVPLEVPAAARWNGRKVRADDLVVCPPRTYCFAFDPAGTKYAIVSAGMGTPLAIAARLLVSSPTSGAVVLPCGAGAKALRDRLESVRDSVEAGRSIQASNLSGMIEAAVISCLEDAAGDQSEVQRSGGRSEIVCRAEEFFRLHVSEGVSIGQLSLFAGVSERSLRNAFYDVYTISPKRYMKLWQLHQVRHALRTGDVQNETVTDVATCHGFYELGRFAGEYKSLFGEPPSATLIKAKHEKALRGVA